MSRSSQGLQDQIHALIQVMKGPDAEGRYWARCLFHDDHIPNMHVFPSAFAHCFVCNRTFRPEDLAKALGLEVGEFPPSDIQALYDYRDADGSLLYQVVRKTGKKFSQRHPDPAKPSEWLWNLKGVQRVLYMLPELVTAPRDAWIFVVEGEKDAGRLASLGLVATTCSGGAGKWRREYNRHLKNRAVVVIPDNDDSGRAHAGQIAQSLSGTAEFVKALELPGLKEKGDVSDWIEAGGTAEELLELAHATPEYSSPSKDTNDGRRPAGSLEETTLLWEGSKFRPVALRIIREGLKSQGRFIKTDLGRLYYFDDTDKKICELGSFDMEILLDERYAINATEQLSHFLRQAMLVEAAQRGAMATVMMFAYYDPVANRLFLDLGGGGVLMLDGDQVKKVDNGSYGVLFMPTQHSQPWEYNPGAEEGIVAKTLIESLAFSTEEESAHTPDEQRLLLLLWLLALPFESVQPTKPLALAMGPAGSGKSLLFRRIGRMLFGTTFDVDGLRRDGEEDFFVAMTNRPFVAFDNVDRYVPWLDDALATTSTGMRVTRRELYTTNRAITYSPKAFVGLTARTPRFRREDVAERLIIFHLDKIVTKRPEHELLSEVMERRDDLLSDYANMLNRVIAVRDIPVVDASIRLADFAKAASRAGSSLGLTKETAMILEKLKRAQYIYATEENELTVLIDAWLSEAPFKRGEMDMGLTNETRGVRTIELYQELKDIAQERRMSFHFKNPVSLGRQLRGFQDALGVQFQVERVRDRVGSVWTFTRL